MNGEWVNSALRIPHSELAVDSALRTPHSAFRLYSPVVRWHIRNLLVVFFALISSACLVVSLQPAYDDSSLTWDSHARRHLEKR